MFIYVKTTSQNENFVIQSCILSHSITNGTDQPVIQAEIHIHVMETPTIRTMACVSKIDCKLYAMNLI